MTTRTPEPHATLLLYVAERLAAQYSGRPEEKEFATLIDNVKAVYEPPQGAPVEHEQGKLPPAPTPAELDQIKLVQR